MKIVERKSIFEMSGGDVFRCEDGMVWLRLWVDNPDDPVAANLEDGHTMEASGFDGEVLEVLKSRLVIE